MGKKVSHQPLCGSNCSCSAFSLRVKVENSRWFNGTAPVCVLVFLSPHFSFLPPRLPPCLFLCMEWEGPPLSRAPGAVTSPVVHHLIIWPLHLLPDCSTYFCGLCCSVLVLWINPDHPLTEKTFLFLHYSSCKTCLSLCVHFWSYGNHHNKHQTLKIINNKRKFNREIKWNIPFVIGSLLVSSILRFDRKTNQYNEVLTKSHRNCLMNWESEPKYLCDSLLIDPMYETVVHWPLTNILTRTQGKRFITAFLP